MKTLILAATININDDSIEKFFSMDVPNNTELDMTWTMKTASIIADRYIHDNAQVCVEGPTVLDSLPEGKTAISLD